jgi:hypothetical protein
LFGEYREGMSKGFLAKEMVFPNIQAMGHQNGAVECEAIQAEKGRLPERGLGELTRIR